MCLRGALRPCSPLACWASPPCAPCVVLPLRNFDPQTTLATTFGAAAKQIASMKLGPVKSIISEYRAFTLVHLDGGALVITLVASSDANLAMALLLAPQLKKALSLLSDQIAY